MVDLVMDEILAKFVVDTQFKSKPKGGNMDDKSMNNSEEEIDASVMMMDPEKYITFVKLHVFPELHDADLDKLTKVYVELRRESSVSFVIKTSVYYLRTYNAIKDE
ncbi:unnamed protein product [Lactuca saligna]|uniref:Uncharacterized protein n=1 Tax=Lactuca saligna TaxID=75948 RepID=A0AA36DXJ7_LACSI|nr:unnamed protein product [Lactuca saligna]